MIAWRNALAALGLILVLTACTSSSSTPDPGDPNPPPPVNRAPAANAGTDADGFVGTSLTVSAAGSTDPDGDVLTYAWTIVSGPGGATLGNATNPSATFLATATGSYVLEVTVRDAAISATDRVTLTIAAAPTITAIRLSGLPAKLNVGAPANLIVRLPVPAGEGGIQVGLTTSAGATIDVPASVLVAEGQDRAVVPLEALDIGTARITATATGLDFAELTTEVAPRLLDLALSTGDAGIPVGGTSTVTVTLLAPAPAGGVRVGLSVGGSANASFEHPQLDIASNETTASTELTAASVGALNITATPASGDSAETQRVLVVPVTASATRTSGSLIDAALVAGTLDADTAAVYRVLAAVGAPELPAQYRGSDTGSIDGGAVQAAAARIATMSETNRVKVAKYLFPPIYEGSWGDTTGVTPGKARSVQPQAADVSCFDALAGMPRTTTLPGWHSLPLPNFRIWYPEEVDPRNASYKFYQAEDIPVAAMNVAATIQETYNQLVTIFGRAPLSDAGVRCNGGDDRIDVYVTRVGLGAKAQVMPHLPGDCARPGWMWIAPDRAQDAKDTRNLVAHELVHLFQLVYSRPNCTDWRYGVLDEATANWAPDHFYPRDNYEHGFLKKYFDSHSGDWKASLLYAPANATVGDGNGYNDYIFFEWLDRKYGPQPMRKVLDASATVNAQRAFEVGLGDTGGGLQALWPQFALSMYDDYKAHVHDELHSWEHASWAGIRASWIDTGHWLNAKLDGAPKKELGSPLIDKFREDGQDDLGPMTMKFVTIKFSDPKIAKITLRHKANILKGTHPRFRMDALQKIDGTWQAVEDWSTEREKIWCRDKKAERIEEIVLVYTNSHAGDVEFDKNAPASIDLGDYEGGYTDMLSVSNAACMPWHGTSSVTIAGKLGSVIHYSANVEYEEMPPGPGIDPEIELPFQYYIPKVGTVHADAHLIDEAECHQVVDPIDGDVNADANVAGRAIKVDYDQRVVSGTGLSTIPGGTYHFYCPSVPDIVTTAPVNVNWLRLPVAGTPLGEDGRTIKGSFVDVDSISGTRTTSEWNFSAEPEE